MDFITDISKSGGLSDEDKLLFSRTKDAVRITSQRNISKFSGFFDCHGEVIVRSAIGGFSRFMIYGGYDGAERKMLGTFSEYDDLIAGAFPITPVSIICRGKGGLTHRDYLGTMMSLGIKRESVGDILVDDEKAVVFLQSTVAQFVINNLDRVGGQGVTIIEGISGELPDPHSFAEIAKTIPSPRIDCIVSALCGVSRAKACELIERGLVQLRFMQCQRVDKTAQSGDTITVRGFGKFIIDDMSCMTKKGRLVLKARKYI